MASNSKIEWTIATWNPVTGCTKISLGCQNCYAERMAKRLKAMHNPSYKNCFKVTCHNRMLELPLKWKKPRMIFVNSMSDLFHKDVPLDFIKKVFDVMKKADWHIYQILTKRSAPNSRPVEEKWVNSIKDYCLTSRIAFFFKQWGGINKKKTGRMLNGRIWNEMPDKFKKKNRN